MPGQGVDVGTGATIAFGTTGFTGLIRTENIRWDGMTRKDFPTSHLGTLPPVAGKIANATFVPGRIVDPGTLTLDTQFNPQVSPPLNGDPELITVTFPKAPADAVPASWACMGFLVGISSITIPFDDKMMATIVIKMSGSITFNLAT